MSRTAATIHSGTAGRHTGAHSAVRDRGFTLVEVTASVTVLLIVLTAAWMLLTVSNDNLNRIDYGSQASELNRAALASFERDLNHGIAPPLGGSPLSRADSRTCEFLADVDKDDTAELVTWSTDDANHRLLRTVSDYQEGSLSERPSITAEYLRTLPASRKHTDVVLDGLATSDALTVTAADGSTHVGPMFDYAVDGTGRVAWDRTSVSVIRMVTMRLRNGLPDETSNVIDRTGAFRVIAYVINGGYPRS